MRIMIIGAGGTIGQAVSSALEARHEIVRVGRKSGTHHADLADAESLRKLFATVGRVDHIISAAGAAKYSSLASLSEEALQFSIANKLMGQVNLVRIGLPFVSDGGSITLTGGVLAHEPEPGCIPVALVNSALEGFVRAAAIEMPAKKRINLVSPPWVTETLVVRGLDVAKGTTAAVVARAYVESVEGKRSGEILDGRKFG